MIIMQVSYASHNYGTVELIKHSVQYQTTQVSPLWKEIRTFWSKNHVLWFPMGFLDAGYPQVSGADQVIVPITSNLRVPIR